MKHLLEKIVFNVAAISFWSNIAKLVIWWAYQPQEMLRLKKILKKKLKIFVELKRQEDITKRKEASANHNENVILRFPVTVISQGI